jgi:hypothetical protein
MQLWSRPRHVSAWLQRHSTPPSPSSAPLTRVHAGSEKSFAWLKYFDAVFVGCAKPSFFQHRAPLFQVDVDTGA